MKSRIHLAASLLSLVALSCLPADAAPPDCPDPNVPEDTVMAIVAARDLYQGVEITEEDLYAVEILPRFLHPYVYQSPEHVVGRIPRQRILANEFIREESLADANSAGVITAQIPRGMRAVSVEVASGVATGIVGGNYVDALGVTRGEAPGVCTIAEGMYVLEARVGEDEARSWLVLTATPDQSLLLSHMLVVGRVSFTLRNDLDLNVEHPAPACVIPAVEEDGLLDPLEPTP